MRAVGCTVRIRATTAPKLVLGVVSYIQLIHVDAITFITAPVKIDSVITIREVMGIWTYCSTEGIQAHCMFDPCKG